jgi:REP element-mobilizing transposase RayT
MTTNRDFTLGDRYTTYFVTFSVIKWIKIFKFPEPAIIFLESLRYVQETQKLLVHAYVIMPSHVHMIVTNKDLDNKQLHKALTSLRKFTGSRIIRYIERNCPAFLKVMENHRLGDRKRMFWQEGWHAEAIYSEKFFHQKMDYIHNNPCVANLVELPEHYLYSSANSILFNKLGFIKLDDFNF